MVIRRSVFHIFVVISTILAGSVPSVAEAGLLERLFAPKANLWQHWAGHDDDSGRTIDHGAWASFLALHVRAGADGINRVDYGNVSAEDRELLDVYIDSMEALRITDFSRREQFAYWVNLYNAVTVDVILEHYPVESIKDIKLSKGVFAKGPWSKKLLNIEGRDVSLNDIEHRILRPIWRDPRMHYAVNCASLGCPNLMPEPLTAENMDRMLDLGATQYVNHARGVRIERGRLYVSSIYSWFRSDFGGNHAGVIDHLRRYADPGLAAALEGIDRIAGDAYDWSLNDVTR